MAGKLSRKQPVEGPDQDPPSTEGGEPEPTPTDELPPVGQDSGNADETGEQPDLDSE